MRPALALALVLTLGLVGGHAADGPASAAPLSVTPELYTLPVDVVGDDPLSFLGLGQTSDPDIAEILFVDGPRFHWEIGTDRFVELPGPTDRDIHVEPGSDVGWEVLDPHTVRRHGSDGATTDWVIPFTFLDWGIGGVPKMSDNGRYWLVTASSAVYGGQRTMLYDSVADELLTPDGAPEYGIGTLRDSTGVAVSDDGMTVWYAERETVGLPWRHVRWDRATDTHTVLGDWPPPATSENGQWSIEQIDDELIRTRVANASTTIVPTLGREIEQFEIVDGGEVIMALRQETAVLGDAVQLYRWDGVAAQPELLSVGADGAPADYGIDGGVYQDFFVANRHGSVVAFTSFATNLAPTIPEPDARRLFVIDTTELPEPDAAAAPIEPGETYCFPAVGAGPGDVAVVNVTPVLATAAGHGTLHSSDEPAGSTSNVNFAPGSVDPNVAFTTVGSDGEICFTNSEHATVHLIADQLLVGDPSALSTPTVDGAARLVDTRRDGDRAPLAPAARRCVDAFGEPGDIAFVNITPVLASTAGHGTLHASDDPAGQTSNVNFRPDSTNPNVGTAAIGSDGQICFTNSDHATVHVVLDQLLVADATMRPPTPEGAARLYDTRDDTPIAPGETRCFPSWGDIAVINLTPVLADASGHGVLHAEADPPGTVSNVNFGVGTVDPNLGFAGSACFTNSEHATVHLVLDQLLAADTTVLQPPTADGAHRLTDTRRARFS
ncbi:MAG: hypothetical protein CL424_11120 [Acidimicrobiaceae bacterium]|nr:hypothetical protein [Acidimicrobiaceae bacterium]